MSTATATDDARASTAKAAVEALFAVLAEERIAIRTLDAKGVEASASRKLELAQVLGSANPAELAAIATEIPRLRAELRRNGVLLAHARRCVNDLIDFARPRIGGARRGSLRARV